MARPTFDWIKIQTYYDEGNSMRGCARHFGMSSRTLVLAVRNGLLKTRNASEALKLGLQTGKIRKAEWTEARRATQSRHAQRRRLGGETNYYKYQYRNIHMDSQWEVDIAIWLDERRIEWKRDKKFSFSWEDATCVSHRYYPDFYLPAFDVYLDPKNKYLIEKDRFKIEAVMNTHGVKIIWGLKQDVIDALIQLPLAFPPPV